MMTGFERDTVNRLKNMFLNMIVPDHDAYAGHSEDECVICQLLADVNEL